MRSSNPQRPAPTPSPTVTIACKGRMRSYRVRPWVAGVVLGGTALFLTAYIAATAYLIYRDDLLGTAVARQVAMQYAYEDRIAALRSELDRITSLQAVKTAGVEEQLAALLDRQSITQRQNSALEGLLERARDTGMELGAAPTPSPPPEREAAPIVESGPRRLAYAPAPIEAGDIVTGTLIRSSAAGRAQDPQELRPLLSEVQSELDRAANRQSLALDALTAEAQRKADKLSAALAPIGITAGEAEPTEDSPRGGPFIPARGLHFVERTAILSRTLDEIAALRRSAEAMPLAMPLRAERISSPYGYRQDPFLNRPALHAGLDFAAPAGTEVRATAAGVVASAGWNGGYGYMVEIRHAGGLSTRYGHLSAILVERGAKVPVGAPIGRVGSTGRSTGPHLHYETRRDGRAVNPAPYLAAGRAL